MIPPAQLTHPSDDDFLMRLKMSAANVIIFVEGPTDEYFYANICDIFLTPQNITYIIFLARELSGDTGGKIRLLRFFDFLNAHSSLSLQSLAGDAVTLFFLDKDVDEHLGKLVRSNHIVYTEYYTRENYLYAYGNIPKAIADACELPQLAVSQHFSLTNDQWRYKAAFAWKSWVELCLMAQLLDVDCECTYSRWQPVAKGCDGYACLAQNERDNFAIEIAGRGGLNGDEFEAKMAQVQSNVDKIFAHGRYDEIFNGKWYKHFLIIDANRIGKAMGKGAVDIPRVEATLRASLDYCGAWAGRFSTAIERVVSGIQASSSDDEEKGE